MTGRRPTSGPPLRPDPWEETATFWESRPYWHPGTETFVGEPFGSGGIGIGHHRLEGDTLVTEQTLYRRDGTASLQGHRSRLGDGVDHSQSFQIEVDGSWTPQRAYVCRRVEASGEEQPEE